MRVLCDGALARLDARFTALYSRMGRPSIPPEMLLRATLLQALYSIRSERQLIEQIDFNLLFRWFVGLAIDDAVWHPTTFSHNRARLMEGDVARELFLAALVMLPEVKALMSAEHFSVGGTLIKARAPIKSFVMRDGTRHHRAETTAATPRWTSAASGAPTTPTRPPPTPMPGCTAREMAARAGSASWATSLWRTGTAWWQGPS